MADLSEKLKQLPENPGVYIMFDANGQIIYVGKAKVLKNRVRQYFHQSGNKTEKVVRMVEKIADFKYIITPSESDALSLEANLIKKHKPYYNILLKDDKAYPYIKTDLTEDFPAFTVTRRVRKDKCRYFGPLTTGVRYKDILDLLSIAFSVRTCGVQIGEAKRGHRACLNYHIGRCTAPCAGLVSREDYRKQVDKAVRFLSGDQHEVTEILQDKMAAASEAGDFETAIVYRDRLKMLDAMKERRVAALAKDVDMDVFSYRTNEEYGAVSLIIVRGGKIVGSENHPVEYAGQTEEEVYNGFLMQYYKSGILIPAEVVTGGETSEALGQVLTERAGHKVNIVVPKQGVRHQLVEMADKNAFDYMEKNIDLYKRKQAMTTGAVELLGRHLELANPPRRMECYDISNISGTDKVSSMVVFEDGEPARQQYRRFRIRTVEGSNDFASMYETLLRRFQEFQAGKDVSFSRAPDLIVIDGGKGQLAYAFRAMEDAGVSFPMVSLAKREEEVFLRDREDPIVIPKTSVALKLLQRLRDEAHRFAITYHRQIRGNHMFTSTLQEVEGVGKARQRALLARFKTLTALKKATAKEIAETPGVSLALAERIRAYLERQA